MVSQGFFSGSASAEKRRFAGERENNANFKTRVEPVKVANLYNNQTPSLDYAPDEVGDYIRDSEIKSYKEKEEKPSYTPPPTATSYYDQTVKESDYGMPHLSGKFLDDRVQKDIERSDRYKNLDDYVRKNMRYGTDEDGTPTATSTSIYNYGQPINVSTEKLKSFMVQDAKENQYQSLVDRAERAEVAEFNKKVDAINKVETDRIVKRYGYDPRTLLDPTAPVGTRIDEKTGLQEYPKRENIFSRDLNFDYSTLDQKTINEIKSDHNLDFDVDRGFYRKEEKQDNNTAPPGAFNITKKEEPKLNRLEEAKKQPKVEETKNIFQKIGDTVGNVFNKITGTEAVADGTLQAQGINTSATQNLRRMGYVSDDLQTARDALAKANLRRSGLDRTIGGKSSQANYGRASRGFGTGTHGKGMPSNPKGMRQQGVGVSANNLSRHKGRSQGRGGSRGGSTGGSGASSKGGTGAGQSRSGGTTGRTASKASRSRTGRSRSQCDIRTKIDISELTNTDLFRDDLADVAYFVKEIR